MPAATLRSPEVPTLSLVIPATKTETLARCLASVAAAADGPDEVIVVERSDAPGPAAARNDGARRATGEVVAFLDADVLVAPDAFTRMRAAFDEDPGLTAVFGSYDDQPADPGVVSRFRNLLHHAVHQASGGEASTFWSGLGAVRRDAFLLVGGYDAERFERPSVEDIDLGMRLRAAGGRLRLDPLLQGRHLKRWTLLSMLRTDLRDRGIPWTRLLLRQGSGSSALNLGLRHRVSALASLCMLATAALVPLAAAVALVALVTLNLRFYGLLVRRLGPWAPVGVALHVLHHVAAVVSVPIALGLHLRGAAVQKRRQRVPVRLAVATGPQLPYPGPGQPGRARRGPADAGRSHSGQRSGAALQQELHPLVDADADHRLAQ
jgi:hypothetical protein